MVNKVLHFLYLVTSDVSGFSIDQVVGNTDASESNESDINIYEILDKQQKDQTGEKYPVNTSQQEDPIYQDIDEKSGYGTANQENSQNKHSDDKAQSYTSINFKVPDVYQTLRGSFPRNQVNEQESGNKSSRDHYASLTETEENDDQIPFQLKPETTYEESGSTSPLYKTLETFDFDGAHS